MFNYEPLEFLAVAGGINAVSIAFVFPIWIHLKCVYSKECKETSIPGAVSNEETTSLIGNFVGNLTGAEQKSISPCESKIAKLRSQSKWLKYTFYMAILTLGLVNCYFVVKRALSGKKKSQAFF